MSERTSSDRDVRAATGSTLISAMAGKASSESLSTRAEAQTRAGSEWWDDPRCRSALRHDSLDTTDEDKL